MSLQDQFIKLPQFETGACEYGAPEHLWNRLRSSKRLQRDALGFIHAQVRAARCILERYNTTIRYTRPDLRTVLQDFKSE